MNTNKIQARGKQAHQGCREETGVSVKMSRKIISTKLTILSCVVKMTSTFGGGGLALASSHHVISLLSTVCLTFCGFIVDQPHSAVMETSISV